MPALSIEGNIVNIDRVNRGRIEIGDDGLIARVTEPTGAADIVLKDELIFPGFVDIHVHARECADHSWDYKEDFATAGAAAINGGVVAFADMPNNPVPPVDEKSYMEKYQLTEKCPVDVVLYAGIGPATKPCSVPNLLGWSEKQPMNGHATDAIPYKVFMGQSIGDLFFSSREQLSKALENYRGQSVSFHCEDPEIMEQSKTAVNHELRRPPEAEVSAVDFALELIKKYELKGKICHISTAAGFAKIAAAKQANLPVTVEVTPHHLFFDNEEIARSAKGEAIPVQKEIASDALAISKFLQVNPPIRQSRENRLALIAALKNGDIDFLATDHAPHTIEEKEKGTSGLPHLDTYGPFVAWLIVEHNFTPEEIARVCSYNPGQWFNQFSPVKFGQIKQGFAGSLTVINVDKPLTIEKSMLKTKCAWSPFEGIEFPGRVVMTIIKGKNYKN